MIWGAAEATCLPPPVLDASFVLLNQVLLGVGTGLIVAGWAGWLLLSDEPRIKVRSGAVNFALSVSVLLDLVACCLRQALPMGSFPCWLTGLLYISSAMVMIAVASVRSLVVVSRTLRTKGALKTNIDLASPAQSARSLNNASFQSTDMESSASVASSKTGNRNSGISISFTDLREFLRFIFGFDEPNPDANFIMLLGFAGRAQYLLFPFAFFYFPCLIVFFILYGILPTWNQGCFDCDLYYEMFIAIIVVIIFTSGPITPLFIRFRKLPDPLGIFREMWLSAIPANFIYLGWILVAANVLPGREMPWEYVVLLSYYLVWFIWTPLQLIVALHDRRIRVAAMANKDPTDLEQILLTNEAVYLAFLEYTEQFYSVEIVKFLKAVLLWKDNYVDKGEMFRKNRAKGIVRLFLTPGSALEVNVSDNARNNAVHSVETNRFDVAVFDECLHEVKSMISHTLWPDFIRQRGGVGSGSPIDRSRRSQAFEATDITVQHFQGM